MNVQDVILTAMKLGYFVSIKNHTQYPGSVSLVLRSTFHDANDELQIKGSLKTCLAAAALWFAEVELEAR